MSETFINQITLECLLNKEMYKKCLRNKNAKKINKEEFKFYKKRIFNLFKELLNDKPPNDLLLDVKYSYDIFITQIINYFKTIDSNDITQSEYKDLDSDLISDLNLSNVNCCETTDIIITNSENFIEKDVLLMRSIQIDIPTLDKYVIKTRIKKKEEFIFPKKKEINLNDPQLKNKGIKKNITNIYEEKNIENKNENENENENEKV